MTEIPAERQDQSTLPQVAPDTLASHAVILDVRNQDEWDLGHAPGAVHIPLDELPDRVGELPRTDGPLPVTCRGGGRAGRAVAWLRAQGIDAANLTGGMLDWQARERPVVGDAERPRIE